MEAGDTRAARPAAGLRWAPVLACWAALLSASGASGQDAPPPQAPPAAAKADPLETEVEAIRRLVGAGLWKAAKSSIDKFFAAHTGDPRVLAHVNAIESDLQKCLFRLSGPQPTPVQLLGRGAVKYDPASGRATFDVSALSEEAGWEASGDVRFFDVLFDGEMSVEMSAETAWSTTVLLGFDSETRGAYAFVPADGSFGRQPFVFRLDPGKEPVEIGDGSLIFLGGTTTSVSYAVSQSKVVVDIRYTKSWNPRDRKSLSSITDGKYRRGFVAVRGAARLDTKGLKIEGRLEPVFAKRQIAEADTRRFRTWRDAHWKRANSIPEWVLGLERNAGMWAVRVPDGCPSTERSALVDLHRAAFEARRKIAELPRGSRLSGAAYSWQEAIVAFGEGRYGDAEVHARNVVAADADFVPAHVLCGRALLGRGDDVAATACFTDAKRLDPAFAPAYDGLALASFRSGDQAAMEAHLADAAAAGTATGLTHELRQVALRARRGPDWKKRFETLTPNFSVTGDASIAVCNEVAKVLEECMDVYGRQFRRRTRSARARVRVFSGFESYADYVSDLGADPTHTLGLYMPSLRELCIHLHEDRPALWNTVRHEAFHQYVHLFAEDVPIWFNEGYAEFFGFSRRKLGKAVVGQVDEEQAEMAKALLPKFTPLDRLFRMESEEFMKSAGVHYVQAWAVVHLLRETSDPALKGLLDRYFDAILAGRSQAEACDEVLAPHVARIESALRSHVAALRSR